jgi:hypothetical protein
VISGRTLAEVRDAAGHAIVSISSGYLHVVIDDDTALGSSSDRVWEWIIANRREGVV